ncbi:hypothetical protein M3A96_05315 [Helcobacillus massiliensis]|uniref:WXG100 family type VII secretion target n=1 Tax=Helcobacillus massiliensis TaxID=521392 RepID=A0A839QN74_9MICO|nr:MULTISPECIES: hypothetical protein [Helcobacillus]MBB3021913.1 hypothetical protein [Helcobacillus massiliensis]MCG7427464.1 hypothetical protein [Helcobacillus sp. ACRRO]MCT1557532.1 hypothetical protein [Helcobacillus massiliensis]MCT2037401.1 hypothetical protein [Helcobacillus massiliensis]MCT2331971.1 hypothetical protein [Helcobacillus massiliensis]
MTFLGMNPTEARRAAQQITDYGQKLDGYTDALRHLLIDLDWRGPDRDTVIERWDRHIDTQLRLLSSNVLGIGESLDHHAAEQEAASAGPDGFVPAPSTGRIRRVGAPSGPGSVGVSPQ